VAKRWARALAVEHAGAVAFPRTGDPATGELHDAVTVFFSRKDLDARKIEVTAAQNKCQPADRSWTYGGTCASIMSGSIDLPLSFHPAAIRASALLICYPSLDRRKVEFSGFCHAGGLDAPAGVIREAGGLLPMAPCGRSSL
jgi:hypothetical protein